jgi:hypothetical protein
MEYLKIMDATRSFLFLLTAVLKKDSSRTRGFVQVPCGTNNRFRICIQVTAGSNKSKWDDDEKACVPHPHLGS